MVAPSLYAQTKNAPPKFGAGLQWPAPKVYAIGFGQL